MYILIIQYKRTSLHFISFFQMRKPNDVFDFKCYPQILATFLLSFKYGSKNCIEV